LHYFVVTQGALIAAGALFANTTEGFAIKNGGFLISSPDFYSKVDDTVTSGGNLGISVPLYAQVADSVYVIMPTYTVAVSNTSGVVLSYAPWTKATAAISAQDKSDIRSGLALETTVSTKASQTSVNAIPTNPLLTTDGRLANLDAQISTRLPTSSYVAPANSDIAAIKAKTDVLPTLVEMQDLPVDIHKINGVVVTGAGVTGDEWGPA